MFIANKHILHSKTEFLLPKNKILIRIMQEQVDVDSFEYGTGGKHNKNSTTPEELTTRQKPLILWVNFYGVFQIERILLQ